MSPLLSLPHISVITLTIQRLTSTNWATLHIAIEEMERTNFNPTTVTRPVPAPVFSLITKFDTGNCLASLQYGRFFLRLSESLIPDLIHGDF